MSNALRVLDGVMLIDLEITGRAETQSKPAVFGNLFEHVIKKTDSRTDLGIARRIEIDVDGNRRFPR